MRGSIKGQTLHILNTSGINNIGKSKFQAKDRARLALGTEGRGGNSRNIAEKIGIHSLGTKDNYLDKWQELGRYVKDEFGMRDFEKITSEHIQAFLVYKMEIGVSYSHWCGYSAAFIKLNTALNNYSDIYKHGNSYSFRKTIESLRPEAKAELPRFNGTRNYANPNELISQISNQTHQLVAKIQHESGLRIAGSTSIQAPQLKGLSTDRHTGKPFFGSPSQKMTKTELDTAKKWISERFTFVMPEAEDLSIDKVLNLASVTVRRKGVRSVVIDPWNELDHSRPSHLSETEYISLSLSKIRRFAREHQVHVWLIAHPAKLRKEKDSKNQMAYPVPTLYDISGSAHWRNKADFGLCVYRDVLTEGSPVQIHVQKVRFKTYGKPGVIELAYDRITGRYLELEDKNHQHFTDVIVLPTFDTDEEGVIR